MEGEANHEKGEQRGYGRRWEKERRVVIGAEGRDKRGEKGVEVGGSEE